MRVQLQNLSDVLQHCYAPLLYHGWFNNNFFFFFNISEFLHTTIKNLFYLFRIKTKKKKKKKKKNNNTSVNLLIEPTECQSLKCTHDWTHYVQVLQNRLLFFSCKNRKDEDFPRHFTDTGSVINGHIAYIIRYRLSVVFPWFFFVPIC